MLNCKRNSVLEDCRAPVVAISNVILQEEGKARQWPPSTAAVLWDGCALEAAVRCTDALCLLHHCISVAKQWPRQALTDCDTPEEG